MTPYYQAGGMVIYHCDARELSLWAAADVLLTDPPYGMEYVSGWSGRSIQNDETVDVRDQVLEVWSRTWGGKVQPGLVFGRWDQPPPKDAVHSLVWDKGDWPGMGDLRLPWGPSFEMVYVLGDGADWAKAGAKRGGSVVRCDRLTGDTLHPNEKPVRLLQQLLQKMPLYPSRVVADPFMGSGATLVAAKNLGWNAIGVELEERYCEVAAKRLSQEVMPW